jgi:hypothetical protein
MVYGTPSHDVDQSLDIFKTLNTKYSTTILEPGQAYGLLHNGGIARLEEAVRWSPKTILFGIPEPRRKYLIADTSAGKDETEEAIRNAMRRLCFMLAARPRVP